MSIRQTIAVVAVFALGTGTLACDRRDPSSPLAPSPAAAVTSPQAQGATIIEDQVTSFTVHLDAARGLLSLHAPSTVCAGGGVPIVDRRRVLTPSEIAQAIFQTSSAAEPVAVYHASSLAEAGFAGTGSLLGFGGLVDVDAFCTFIEGPARIAEGTVRRFGTLSNASFAIHWVGTLTGVDGRPYHLTEVYQLGGDAHDPNNPAFFVEHLSRILLSPRH